MMRANFAADFYTARTRFTNESHTASRREVLTMNVMIAEFREQDVAHHHRFLPRCASEPIGASCSPARFFEIAPVGKTFTHATAAARSLIHAMVLGLSAAGEVFGMQTTVVNPPAAAAPAPDSIVSLWLNPGSRR